MRMTVADLMCEMPVTVGPECTTDEALEAFYEHETPELYVVDESGYLLGVLPDYELLKAQLSGEAKGACVEQLMSTSVPVCRSSSDAAGVARAFRDSQCNRMPVVQAGRLVGVVTRADVLRLMAVLRRIEMPEIQSKPEPKRPKHLDATKAGTARNARAKTVSRKAATGRTRSKSAARSAR